jgi:hypothetical protein
MLYLFSSFDGIIINITTDILNESYIYQPKATGGGFLIFEWTSVT